MDRMIGKDKSSVMGTDVEFLVGPDGLMGKTSRMCFQPFGLSGWALV